MTVNAAPTTPAGKREYPPTNAIPGETASKPLPAVPPAPRDIRPTANSPGCHPPNASAYRRGNAPTAPIPTPPAPPRQPETQRPRAWAAKHPIAPYRETTTPVATARPGAGLAVQLEGDTVLKHGR